MNDDSKTSPVEQFSELLIRSDGRIFVHNLTTAMAGLLTELDPKDAAMRLRAESVAAADQTSLHLQNP